MKEKLVVRSLITSFLEIVSIYLKKKERGILRKKRLKFAVVTINGVAVTAAKKRLPLLEFYHNGPETLGKYSYQFVL